MINNKDQQIKIKGQCDRLEKVLNALPENQGVFEQRIGNLLVALRRMSILINSFLKDENIEMAKDDRTERQAVIDELINELDPNTESKMISQLKRMR